MKGQIIKIHPIKRSRNGNSFIRIEFRLEGGVWAKSDLCPDFRNYSRWRNLLIEGLDLEGLDLKFKSEVDADSYPRIIKQATDGYWTIDRNGDALFVRKVVTQNPLPELPEEGKKLIQPKLI